MDTVVNTIIALSSNSEDLSHLQKTFGSYDATIAANVDQIPAALQALDAEQHALGVCFLLLAQLKGPMDAQTTHQFFDYASNFLKVTFAPGQRGSGQST